MTTFFKRAAVLHAGTRRITGLRVAFKVGKTDRPEPNQAEVSIYNLSPEARAEFQRRPLAFIVEAGYDGRTSVLFSGEAQAVDHVVSGPDVVTRIRAGDGERQFRQATFSASFRPGTSMQDVILEVVKGMGLDVSQLRERLSRHDWRGAYDQLLNGWAGQGRTAPELDKLLSSAGLTWSIQDGALQVLGEQEPSSEDAILLSSSTGLLGSPEYGSPDKKGGPVPLKVRSLLQPGIKPGRQLAVKSKAIDGRFRVTKVLHTGDTHGQDWQSEAEALPL